MMIKDFGKSIMAATGLFLGSCTSLGSAPQDQSVSAVPQIVFDTDFGGDADDLGAIAMLHHYADLGIIDLKAITLWSNEKYVLPALSAVNTYYGRPDLAVGVREVPVWRTDWNHTKVIADQFPHNPRAHETTDGAVAVLRQTLAVAEPNSITIVTVGPLANIRNLLDSPPDQYSTLTGAALFEEKVDQVVIMGGQFPDGRTEHGVEWNFDGNMPGVTKAVLESIPRPIVFSGYEIGNALKVGQEFNAHPSDTPLYVGYKYFSEHAPWINQDYAGEILDNSSFDQTAVMFAAIGGVDEYWRLSARGTLSADEAGNGIWTDTPSGQHRYLILRDNIEATERYLAEMMMYIPDVRPRVQAPASR
ncbi:MAG: nucleoside hydrolase [Pseudomonadota bacterium]